MLDFAGLLPLGGSLADQGVIDSTISHKLQVCEGAHMARVTNEIPMQINSDCVRIKAL
jgi:hypothetical protein